MVSLHYGGYSGSYEYKKDEKTFYGKLDGIKDLVTFQGDDVLEVDNAFMDAVEDYIQLLDLKPVIDTYSH